MAKCNKCGRKGLFFKVNSDGLCNDCAALTLIAKEKQELEDQIQSGKLSLSEIRQKIANESADLENLKNERQKTYDTIKRQAECAAIANVKNQITELEREQEVKQETFDKLTAEVDKLSSDSEALQKKYHKMKTLFESYQSANKKYVKEGETDLYEGFLDKLGPTIEIQLNCMNVKQLRSLYNQNKKLISDCLARYEGRYTTKTNAALYKLMTTALEAELQNILHTINYGKLDTAEKAVTDMTAKYLAIAVDGNQSIAPTMKKFIGEIEHLFLEAVKIEYEYFVQKERIKEEQRALREQMRQEAEERKQLEAQRKQVEKEESKYQTEMQNVQEQIRNSEDAEKIALLEARLAEIQAQLDNVEQRKEDIIKLQNGKAGYVYVISNLGSFGDNVFKVGMTRRLEPMDRVKELGDASVPFPFDVHSFIFSDDAVSLEHTLHVELNERRVNKVNLRKEFFRVSVDELEELVYKHQPTAEFNRTMLAEQYNQSLSTDFVREELTEFEDE